MPKYTMFILLVAGLVALGYGIYQSGSAIVAIIVGVILLIFVGFAMAPPAPPSGGPR